MAHTETLTVRALEVRPIQLPLQRPLQTASGEIPTAPLVLIDLETEEGVTGRTYLFCYTPIVLESVARLVAELGQLLAGERLAPVQINRTLQAPFKLLRPQGLVMMAISGIDMAAWDALAKAADLPLVRLLGGDAQPVPAYGSLKTMKPHDAAEEAGELSAHGFSAYKVKIGLSDVDADREVISAIREVIGDEAQLAVDYNQSLSVPEAVRRARALSDERLLWIEEPTRADDYAGHARVRGEITTPVQLGESWWGTDDMAKSIAAGAGDFAMLDIMRIGGVTGWQRAAALAEAGGLPLSSHLFVEISAHLLAVTPTAHLLEYLDIVSPILQAPAAVSDGHVQISQAPGVGIEWDEDAIARLVA